MSAPFSWQVLESDERRALRDSVRAVAQPAWGPQQRVDASDIGRRRRLWDGLRGLGAIGLTVPVADGGNGGTAADAAALACEVGHDLLPLSTAEALVVGPQLLVAVRDQKRGNGLVGSVLDGSRRATAHLDLGHIGRGIRLRSSGTGYRAEGSIQRIAGLRDAELLVLVVPSPESVDRFAVLALARAQLAPSMKPVPADDYYGDASLVLDLDLPPDALIGFLGADIVQAMAQLTAALHCFEIGGALDALMSDTAAHLGRRQQFGRPLIQFQALQHKLADVSVAHYLVETAALASLQHIGQPGRDGALDPGEALEYVTTTYQDAVELALQLHGAIGFTWEAGLHRYLRHAIRTTALASA